MVIFGWRRRPSTLISSSISTLPQVMIPLPLLVHPGKGPSPLNVLPSAALKNCSSGRNTAGVHKPVADGLGVAESESMQSVNAPTWG
jgi:hypothetical protein